MLTIHSLSFPPNSAFDIEGSATNTKWNDALLFLLEQPGSRTGRWGRQFKNRNCVILLAYWHTQQDTARFLSEAYAQFEGKISPLLDNTPPTPDLVDMSLNWAIPASSDGGEHTTIYKNTFSKVAKEEREWSLLQNVSFYVQSLHGGIDGDVNSANEGYLNSGYAWTIDPSTGLDTHTCYIAIAWQSLEAEKKSGDNFMCEDGSKQMVKRLLYEPVLDRADTGGECFRVSWREARASELRALRPRAYKAEIE